MQVVYEDNHIIVVNKSPGEIVQGDKPGVPPRIDRPVSGLVIFARTSKALERLNRMFREGEVHKTYHALVEGCPERPEALLENWLLSDGRINKTFVSDSHNPDAKLSRLEYRVIKRYDRYTLLEVNLLTGRKHQIRAQLAATGHPIKGDLKYGARRSNRDGGISLQAHRISFTHPVSKQPIDIELPDSPTPADNQK